MALVDAQLLEILRSPEFRVACVQHLVAASIDPAEGYRIMEDVIDRVREEARGPVPRIASRLLRAMETACAKYAELRCLPYKKVVGPLIRGWSTWMRFAAQAGLTEEEGYAVIRDLLRRIPSSHWSQAKSVDRELAEELKYAFSILGIARGHGPVGNGQSGSFAAGTLAGERRRAAG